MLCRVLILLALVLVGCGGGRKFEVKRALKLDSTSSTVTQNVMFDLFGVAEVAQVRGRISSLRLESADATITSVALANRANTLSGVLTLRAEGGPSDGSQDTVVGTLTTPLIANITAGLPGNEKIDAFLLKMAQGTGRFLVLCSGETDGEPHFTLELKLHGLVSP